MFFPDNCRAIFCNLMSARCVGLQFPSILVVTKEAIRPQTGKLSGIRLKYFDVYFYLLNVVVEERTLLLRF